MRKIATGLTDLRKRVGILERHPVTTQSMVDTRKAPNWVIITRFQVKDTNTVNEQAVVQKELQQLLTDFCREASIEELSILFRENV